MGAILSPSVNHPSAGNKVYEDNAEYNSSFNSRNSEIHSPFHLDYLKNSQMTNSSRILTWRKNKDPGRSNSFMLPPVSSGSRRMGLASLSKKFKQINISSEVKRPKRFSQYENTFKPPIETISPYLKNGQRQRNDTSFTNHSTRTRNIRASVCDVYRPTPPPYNFGSTNQRSGTPYCRVHNSISQDRTLCNHPSGSMKTLAWDESRESAFSVSNADETLHQSHAKAHLELENPFSDMRKRHSECAFHTLTMDDLSSIINQGHKHEDAPHYNKQYTTPLPNTRFSVDIVSQAVRSVANQRRVSSISPLSEDYPNSVYKEKLYSNQISPARNPRVPILALSTEEDMTSTTPKIHSCPYHTISRPFSFVDLCIDSPSMSPNVELQPHKGRLISSPVYKTRSPTVRTLKNNSAIRKQSEIISSKENRIYKSLTKSLSCYALRFLHPHQTNSNRDLWTNFENRKFKVEQDDSKNDTVGKSHHSSILEDGIWKEKPKISIRTNRKQISDQHKCEILPVQEKRQICRYRSCRESPYYTRHGALISFKQNTGNDAAYFDPAELSHAVLTTSTGELLRSLSFFLVAKMQLMCLNSASRVHHSSLRTLQPSVIVTWIKVIDRALLIQGWSDVAFINPTQVIFLFMLLKDIINCNISTEQELHSIIMACLYLSYSYIGNEISYPLKPFLVAQTNQLLLQAKDGSNNRRPVDGEKSLLNGHANSIRAKTIDQVRNRFWQHCLRIVNAKSRDMLRVHADPVRFKQLFVELKSYDSLVVPMRAFASSKFQSSK